MLNKQIFFVLVFLFSISLSVLSQNNTNSPYTRFGYGEISDANSGDQKAMGGTALGARLKNGINPVNPASYSVVDSMTFMFDFGLGGLISKFSDTNGRKTSFNSNLEYITMLFPLAKNIGFSAGLLPYSFSGYNFYNTDTLSLDNFQGKADTVTYKRSFYGSGGISQIYAGLSLNLFNHISVGANAYYMFGSLSNYRSLTFNQSSDYYSTQQRNSIDINNFRFRYGLQLYNTFASKHEINLGFIYENKALVNGKFSQITSGVLTDSVLPINDFEMPTVYGGGLRYTYDKKLTLAADYVMHKWGEARYFGKTDSLVNRAKYYFGAQYVPDYRGRNYFDRVQFRAGFNISNPYYKIGNGMPPLNFGITFGMGFPLKNSNTIVNTSFEYGKIGATGLLREDYLKFTLNATFNENWFFKRKL